MKTTVGNTQNKRDDKKQVNIAWNSRLVFQVGVIVSGLLVFILMQTSFKVTSTAVADKTEFNLEEPPMINFEIDIEKPKPISPVKSEPVKPKAIPKPIKTDIVVVKENTKEVETEIMPTDLPIDEPSVPDQPVVVTPEPSKEEPAGPSSILNVEFVPVFPGCEGLASNAETIECLSSQISVFVSNNFKKDALDNLQSNTVQRVSVQFKVDSNGFITDIRTNSNVERINREVKRVIGNLPRMKPGRQGDRAVDVLYTVPIVFRIP